MDGQTYVLTAGTGVTRSPLIEWPANTRLDGQQRRKDRRLLSSLVIDSWVSGLGRQEVNVATAADLSSIWDAENVDTRIDGQIVLSPALNTVTIVPSRGDLDHHLDFGGELYFVESQRVSTQSNGLGSDLPIGYAYKFTGPLTLASLRAVGIARGSSGDARAGSISGLTLLDGNIALAFHGGEPNAPNTFLRPRNLYSSTPTLGGIMLGSFMASMSVMGSIPITRFTEMLDFNSSLRLLEYRSSNLRAGFWTGNKTGVSQVATKSSEVGTYLPDLVTDGLTVFAQLPQGVFDFDSTPAIVVDTGRAQDKNGALGMFANKLLFKNKKSLIQWDGATPIGVGYDLRDGLKGEKMGEITAMTSSWERTFAAVKGATYSHILTKDTNNVWQYYARVPTPGIWVRKMFLSDAPDAIDRLWVLFGNHGFPGYYLNPMVNPLQAATDSFVPTGHFTYPIYGGDLPEENGAFYYFPLTADGMGGSNIIHILYGLNGADPVTTLGVVSTTNFAHVFGSPAGVEAFRLQPEFVLAGANAGTTPILRQAIAHYLKLPEQRETFSYEVDLKETARFPVRPLENIIGSMNFERASRTLMPFWYGQIGTKYVKVIDMPSSEDVEDQKIFQGEREGFVRVRLAEL